MEAGKPVGSTPPFTENHNEGTTPVRTPPLPPVNYNSPLVVGYGAQPTLLDSAREQELSNDSAPFNVGRLRSALSEDAHGEMMRKVSTAPIALNYLAVGVRISSPNSRNRSGGPMRRVSTSIGPLSQRRATSFMWSMDVHRDFEHAVQTLLSRGRDMSAIAPAEVLDLMKFSGMEGLNEISIERHLQKRAALQHKLSAMMPPPPMASQESVRMPAVPSAQAEAPAIAPADAMAASDGGASLAATMQRQQAMQRQIFEQQRTLQALEVEGSALTTST